MKASKPKTPKKPSSKPTTATMLFHGFGVTSEEEHDILKTEPNGTIVLDTNEDPSKCFRFNPKTGACLNDVTDFGCYRTLKVGV